MKIRYYGHVGMQTGYGNAGVGLCRALLRAGADLEIRPIGSATVQHARAALRDDMPLATRVRADGDLSTPDAVIIHTLPVDCPRVAELANIGNAHAVAYTTWETTNPPDAVAAAMDWFDDVWVPSRVTAASGIAGRQCTVVPHAYDDEADRQTKLTATSIASRFQFYYVGAWTQRKNPMGVIRAFAAEFTASDPVALMLHSPGATVTDLALEIAATGIPRDDLPPITLSNYPISDADLQQLHLTKDCFVTAARGEAWNLPAFDALMAGTMVISPMGLGSDEFLMDTDSLTYGSTLTPVRADASIQPPTPGQAENAAYIKVAGGSGVTCRDTWREPDLMALRRHMRRIAEMPRHLNVIHYDPAAIFGYAAVGKQILSELENA